MKKHLVLLTLSSLGYVAVSCTPQQAKTAESVGVRIADDVCHEVDDAGVGPEWISLLCAGLDVANALRAEKVRVVMPRAEWHAIKARKPASPDAGAAK